MEQLGSKLTHNIPNHRAGTINKSREFEGKGSSDSFKKSEKGESRANEDTKTDLAKIFGKFFRLHPGGDDSKTQNGTSVQFAPCACHMCNGGHSPESVPRAWRRGRIAFLQQRHVNRQTR